MSAADDLRVLRDYLDCIELGCFRMHPPTTKLGAEAFASAQKVFERWRDAVTEAHMANQAMAAVAAIVEEHKAHSSAMTDAVERLEAERDAALARAKISEQYYCAMELQCANHK